VLLVLGLRTKKCVYRKERDSRRRLLYIACPERTRVAIMHMAIAVLRADPLDMQSRNLSFWVVSHMSGSIFLFWRREEENIDFLDFIFWKEEVWM